MVVPLTLLLIIAVATFFFFRRISHGKINAMSDLSRRRQSVESKYDYLARKKRKLQAELTKKEKRLASLINNQQGIRIKTAAEMNIEETNPDERIGSLLISMDKISVEQNEKVRRKMEVLKMDYLSTCFTLGYIDRETSEKILKSHKRTGH